MGQYFVVDPLTDEDSIPMSDALQNEDELTLAAKRLGLLRID